MRCRLMALWPVSTPDWPRQSGRQGGNLELASPICSSPRWPPHTRRRCGRATRAIWWGSRVCSTSTNRFDPSVGPTRSWSRSLRVTDLDHVGLLIRTTGRRPSLPSRKQRLGSAGGFTARRRRLTRSGSRVNPVPAAVADDSMTTCSMTDVRAPLECFEDVVERTRQLRPVAVVTGSGGELCGQLVKSSDPRRRTGNRGRPSCRSQFVRCVLRSWGAETGQAMAVPAMWVLNGRNGDRIR